MTIDIHGAPPVRAGRRAAEAMAAATARIAAERDPLDALAGAEALEGPRFPERVPLLAPADRLLALLAGLDRAGTALPVLAAYADLSTAAALRHLAHLARIGLVDRGKGDEQAFRLVPGPAPVRARVPGDAGHRRATTWYLGCAFQAARVLGADALPGGEQIPADPLRPPYTPTGRYGALEWFATTRGQLTSVLERACGLRDDAQAWRLALLMLNLGCFAGPWDGWREVHGRGMAAARRDRHRGAQAMLDEYAGKLELTGGDAAAARGCHQRSLEIRSADGDVAAMSRSVNALGVACLREGALSEAETLFARALVFALEAHDEEFATFASMNLGAVHARDGRPRQAVTELEIAAARLRAAGREPYVANALADLAAAHLASGDLDRAQAAAVDAEQAAVDAGVPMFLPDPLIQHAYVLIGRGDLRMAVARLHEARGVYLALGDELRAASVDRQIGGLGAEDRVAEPPATAPRAGSHPGAGSRATPE